MEKESILCDIKKYLSNRWMYFKKEDKEIYRKKENVRLSRKKRIISLEVVYNTLFEYLKNEVRDEFHFESIINEYYDTDYVIAGLQTINRYFEKAVPLMVGEWYYFQPVIRNIPYGKSVDDGMIRTFVNVGTIYVGATLKDYFKDFELWITALSKCSIYADSIELQIKTRTNIYDGVGIRILVGSIEVGQANIYEITFSDNQKYLVTDFGFGLERIAWATNYFTKFGLLCVPNIDLYFGKQDVCLMVSEYVLLALSGVKLNSSKYGLKMKRIIVNIISNEPRWKYDEAIIYYCIYWKKFLNTKIDIQDVIDMFERQYKHSINAMIKDMGDL